MKILVAGIGNIFFGDDGFGVEVANRLATMELPAEVRVVDYGIRGMHLAYDMLAGYDVTVLVDAVPRAAEGKGGVQQGGVQQSGDQGDGPGTVYVIDVAEAGAGVLAQPRQLDPHGMTPDAVLAHLHTLGGDPGHVFVVGCVPADCDERIGLSPSVAAAVENGVTAVIELVRTQLAVHQIRKVPIS